MQRFSLPDTKLLKWSEEDKATDPEAATLGADLDAGQELYKELQERYITKESNNNNNDLAVSNSEKHDSTVPATTSTTTQQRESASVTTVVTPATPQANLVATSTAVGAHSYEDPSFFTFFQEDINKLKDLADTSDTEKQGVIAVTVAAGGGGHSYEDPKFVEALSEGNVITNAFFTN